MTSYLYGKDITRDWFPTLRFDPVSLPAQNPTIYLFSNRPSPSDAGSGVGAFATITSWSEQTTSPYRRRYTVPALDDPDTDSLVPLTDIWEAINFVYQSGETAVNVVRKFTVERPTGTDSVPGAEISDLTGIFPSISSYCTDGQLTTHLNNALLQLKMDLTKRNPKWYRYLYLDTFKLAQAYKALSSAFRALSNEPDDKHDRNYEHFKEEYEAALSSIPLPVDNDDDGEAETTVVAAPIVVPIGR